MNAILVTAVAAGAAFVAIADAHAQTRRERGPVVRANSAPPLTIRQRSFLDPGPIVQPRTMHNYVNMDTAWRVHPVDHMRGRMGLETLPRRFDPPGRPSPLFEF